MGKVIAMTPSRISARHTPAGGSAEILFFMGVRYYRMSDEDVAKATAPKPHLGAKSKTTGASRRLRRHG